MNSSILSNLATRVRHVVKLQLQWWQHESVGVRDKMLFSMTSTIAPFTGRVRYLGKPLRSDNKVGLLLLPEYARTVADVIKQLNTKDPSQLSILDVGANIGQFAATATRMFDSNVVSVEPNPVCWDYLEFNGADSDNWRLQRRGLADESKVLELYFVRNKSAQGSFSPTNAGSNLISGGQVESVSVEVGPYKSLPFEDVHFDLVKVDVEGFEIEVMKGLQGVKFDYLLIEIDEGRDHGFTQVELADVTRKVLGVELEEIWCDSETPHVGARNVLYRSIATA